MFVRARWFLLGVAATLGVVAWLTMLVRRARERLTPAAMGRAATVAGATMLEAAGRRIAPAPGGSRRGRG